MSLVFSKIFYEKIRANVISRRTCLRDWVFSAFRRKWRYTKKLATGKQASWGQTTTSWIPNGRDVKADPKKMAWHISRFEGRIARDVMQTGWSYWMKMARELLDSTQVQFNIIVELRYRDWIMNIKRAFEKFRILLENLRMERRNCSWKKRHEYLVGTHRTCHLNFNWLLNPHSTGR